MFYHSRCHKSTECSEYNLLELNWERKRVLLRKEPWLRKLEYGSEEPQINHSGVHIFQLFDKHSKKVSFQNHIVQTMTAFHLSHSHNCWWNVWWIRILLLNVKHVQGKTGMSWEDAITADKLVYQIMDTVNIHGSQFNNRHWICFWEICTDGLTCKQQCCQRTHAGFLTVCGQFQNKKRNKHIHVTSTVLAEGNNYFYIYKDINNHQSLF